MILHFREQVLDLASAQIGFGIIERDRSMQTALWSFQPLARLVQSTKKVHGVAEEARIADDFAGFISREVTTRLAFRNRVWGKSEARAQFLERKIELLPERFEFSEFETARRGFCIFV